MPCKKISKGARSLQCARLRSIEELTWFSMKSAGVRGAAPVDKLAAADALARFSVMCATLGATLGEIDVNPVVVSPSGVLAIDALVIPAAM
jgi:hypothetical protein